MPPSRRACVLRAKRALRQEIRHVEQPVTEIGLGDRAEADNGFRLRHARAFARVGVRGMDQAPALAHFDRVHQQIDRALAVRGDAVVDLARLLADMDVRRRRSERPGRPGEIVCGAGGTGFAGTATSLSSL